VWILVVLIVAAAAFVGVQLGRGVPSPAVHATAPVSIRVPGAPPAIPWPAKGEAAVALAGAETLGSSGGSAPIPIASLTKIMTALVVLRDHPLGPADPGPTVAITPADVAAYQAAVAAQESVVQVAAGETINERQMLDALLVGSADNMATVLANWDAGTEPAFVAKMNAAAAAMGMGATHYADASGLNSASVSNAGDQLAAEQAAMASPTFAAIVRQPEVTLPVAGRIFNFNRLVGTDGIVGIKTGNTTAAGGCWAFAADRTVGGQSVTVLGVVLGQMGPSDLDAGLNAGKALLDAAGAALVPVTVVPAGQPAATVTAPWLTGNVPASTGGAVSLVGWAGMNAQAQFRARSLGTSFPAGTVVGSLGVHVANQAHVVAVKADKALAGPSLRWRLTRLSG
jgi:serine-type D-Ala-D-Ala carboxypeptidase (penicillin-binding protein 5/6)